MQYQNDDYYARDARVLVESQAVDFEWHTTVALHVPIYRIHLPIQPRSNPFWTAVVNAARNLCLEKLEAASDELRQYFVRPDAYLSTEPYFGVRSFAEDIPAAMGMFTCTSEQDAQAFYDALAVSAGWPPLIWKPLPEQRNSQGAYPQGFSFMPKWVS